MDFKDQICEFTKSGDAPIPPSKSCEDANISSKPLYGEKKTIDIKFTIKNLCSSKIDKYASSDNPDLELDKILYKVKSPNGELKFSNILGDKVVYSTNFSEKGGHTFSLLEIRPQDPSWRQPEGDSSATAPKVTLSEFYSIWNEEFKDSPLAPEVFETYKFEYIYPTAPKSYYDSMNDVNDLDASAGPLGYICNLSCPLDLAATLGRQFNPGDFANGFNSPIWKAPKPIYGTSGPEGVYSVPSGAYKAWQHILSQCIGEPLGTIPKGFRVFYKGLVYEFTKSVPYECDGDDPDGICWRGQSPGSTISSGLAGCYVQQILNHILSVYPMVGDPGKLTKFTLDSGMRIPWGNLNESGAYEIFFEFSKTWGVKWGFSSSQAQEVDNLPFFITQLSQQGFPQGARFSIITMPRIGQRELLCLKYSSELNPFGKQGSLRTYKTILFNNAKSLCRMLRDFDPAVKQIAPAGKIDAIDAKDIVEFQLIAKNGDVIYDNTKDKSEEQDFNSTFSYRSGSIDIEINDTVDCEDHIDILVEPAIAFINKDDNLIEIMQNILIESRLTFNELWKIEEVQEIFAKSTADHVYNTALGSYQPSCETEAMNEGIFNLLIDTVYNGAENFDEKKVKDTALTHAKEFASKGYLLDLHGGNNDKEPILHIISNASDFGELSNTTQKEVYYPHKFWFMTFEEAPSPEDIIVKFTLRHAVNDGSIFTCSYTISNNFSKLLHADKITYHNRVHISDIYTDNPNELTDEEKLTEPKFYAEEDINKVFHGININIPLKVWILADDGNYRYENVKIPINMPSPYLCMNKFIEGNTKPTIFYHKTRGVIGLKELLDNRDPIALHLLYSITKPHLAAGVTLDQFMNSENTINIVIENYNWISIGSSGGKIDGELGSVLAINGAFRRNFFATLLHGTSPKDASRVNAFEFARDKYGIDIDGKKILIYTID